MPRCQRTFRKLPIGIALPGVGTMRWTCPHCAERETYQTLRDGDLLHFADLALNQAVRDFGPPQDIKRPMLLLTGLHPECVRETDDKRYDIYLQAGSDAFQLRLQIGHEIFHRVCSEGRIFHWTHEMLACVFSVRLLRQHNLVAYAEAVEAQFAEQSRLLTIEHLQAAPLDAGLMGYVPGLYGRAFATGRALVNVAGWPALCKLARHNRSIGPKLPPVPDVIGWLETLSVQERHAACGILGITGV